MRISQKNVDPLAPFHGNLPSSFYFDPERDFIFEVSILESPARISAEAIIAGRPYKRVDDLLEVKGIGKGKLEKIRPYFKN